MIHEMSNSMWALKILIVLIAVVVTWLALRWKKMLYAHFLAFYSASPDKHDASTLRIIFKLLTAVIIALATLVILQILGVNVMPLLAFGGIGAAAVGFAAKDVIANFFGGLMLFVNRPFTEGHEIYLCKEGIEGRVEKIGWYSTTVRDKNKCLLFLPNALFSNAFVVNRSTMSHRCIEETLDIHFQDVNQIPTLTEDLHRLLTSHPAVDLNQPLLLGLDSLGEYAFQIRIKLYTQTIQESVFMGIRQDILLKIYSALKNNKIDMPYPTQSVILSQENGEPCVRASN